MSRDRPDPPGEARGSASDVASFFDEIAPSWSARYSVPSQFQKRLRVVLSWCSQEEKRERLLDYGCGSGVLTTELVGNGSHVTAVDISPAMIEAARASLEARGLNGDRYRLELVDAEDFGGEYLAERYDGVVCLGVFEYVERHELLASFLARCVRPSGFLIVMVPNRRSILRTFERIIYRHPRYFRRLSMFEHLTRENSYLRHQRRCYTIDELDDLLVGSGLVRERALFFAAPNALRSLERLQRVGFQTLALYRRPGSDEPPS